MKTLHDRLLKLWACSEAVEWVGDRDLKTVWAECERADWMLWFAERTKCPRPLIVLAACACARRALKYVPDGEDRPRLAIEAVEKWAKRPTTKTAAAWAAARDAASAAAWAAELKIMAGLVREMIPVGKLK